MRKTSLIALAATMLTAATGCFSANRIVGHELRQVGRWYGELGITGHLNEVTIQSRSRLTKLSIIGDANHVMVEDHATLAKIEIWGENNTVSIPAHLVVRVNQVGKGSRVIRRPGETEAPIEPAMETYAPPTRIEVKPPIEPAEEPVAEPATGEELPPPADSDQAGE